MATARLLVMNGATVQKKGNMNEQNGEMLRVDTGGRKYTVIQDETGRLSALRHGVAWRDCVGDNLIHSLASDLDEERQKKLLPKIGASGILCNNSRVLLGRRNADDTQGGKWVTPGGGVEPYESIDKAVVREFLEETGLLVMVMSSFMCVAQERISELEGKHTIMIFKKVCYDTQYSIHALPEAKPLDGFDKVGWFNYDEIMEMGERDEITDMTFRAIKSMV